MTKVPLRAYLAEIQEAIEQKQTEEAVAHCRHILQTFPKHIETYRLLGKAYLESQRYGNAADIFQRVLSSIPDDFVSHVGMSIIREDETNLDEAIWHMERAYESQPYNTAIQSELRRLYGRRDGTEPPKIRLTRGALARMYLKGNLYEQAIAELRAALVKDPQRADLQVFLATSYAQSGKRNEAIETCGTLLQRLPYCLEANRLLAQLMPDTGNAEEMQICRQRIQAMDPYEAYISPQAPTAEDVPSQAVSLYRLEWDGGPAIPQTSAQPEWATSIGVSLGDSDSDDESLPDWLSASPEEEPVIDLGSTDSSPEAGHEGIPDWMQEAGWGPSTGEFDESKSAFLFDEEEGEAGEAIAADIPDWLQGMAPEDAFEPETDSAAIPESPTPDLPDWLDEEPDGASETIISWLDDKDKTEGLEEADIPDLAEPSDEVPDWLQEMGVAAGAVGSGVAAASTFLSDEGETEAEELPDWLQDLGEDVEPTEEVIVIAKEGLQAEAADIPDWLQDLGEDVEPSEDAGILAEEELEAEGEVPDWLQDLGKDVQPSEEAGVIAEEEPEAEAAVIPDWLQGLGEDVQPSEDAGILAEEELEAEGEIPDWLQDLGEDVEPTEEAVVITEEELQAEAADIPDWLQDLGEDVQPSEEAGVIAEEEPEAEAADIPDWLQDLGEDVEPVEEAGIIAEEELETEAAEIPDWFQDLGKDVEPVEEAGVIAEEEFEAEVEIPDWLQDLGEDVEPTEEAGFIAEELEAEIADIPDWLQELDSEDAPISEPTGVTSWLQSISSEGTSIDESDSQSEEEIASESEIPDWLQEFSEEETPDEEESLPEEAPSAEATEVPDWLHDISEDFPPTVEVRITPDSEPEAAEIPDWLQEADEEAPSLEAEAIEEELEAEAVDIPDWLQEFDEEETPLAEAESIEEELDVESTEIPDLFQELGEETPLSVAEVATSEDTYPEIKEEISEEALPPEAVDEFDAAMAWLESLAAKQGVSEEELLTSPEERSETPPDWIKSASAEPSEPEDEFPEWLAEIGVDETEIPEPEIADRGTGELVDASAAIAWLESLDLSEDHEAEEPAQDTEAEFPEWLAEPEPVEDAEITKSPEAEKIDFPPDQDFVDTDKTAIGEEAEDHIDEKVESEFQFEDSDSALAWLEGLAAKQGVSEDELISRPDERSETPPDWVQDMVDKPSAAVTAPLDQIESVEPDLDLPDLPDESKIWDQYEQAEKPDIEDFSIQPEAELAESEIEQEKEVDISPTSLIEEPLSEIFQTFEEKEEETPVVEDTSSELDFENADAALAWLEGLAAKQGVSEEELLTSPEERSETPPDWVQDFVSEAETQVEIQADGETEEEIEPFEETETQEMPDWLKESIAAADSVDDTDIEEDLEPEPDLESIPEDIPNWLRDTMLGEAVSVKDSAIEIESEESQPEVVETPDILPAEETEQEPLAESPQAETGPVEIESETSLEVESPPEDVIKPPSWVTDEEAPDEDEYTWLTPKVIEEFTETSDSLLNINQASLIQLERLPGMGFIRAQAVINHRNEHGEFSKLDDLLNIPEIDAEILEAIRPHVMAVVTPSKKPAPKPGTGPLIMPITTEKPEDQFHAQQIEAQIKLAEGDIDGALAQYGRLIKKGKRLDGIIEDLNQALYQVPMDVSVNVLQTLGDAYMRAGQLQEALDMYTKAEELLR